MKAAAILPWIPVFPLIGFLVNGLLYLVSHAKLGGADAPKGAHGAGHEGGHDGAVHGGAHGAHPEIPFAGAHSIIGPAACALSFLASILAIAAWWSETHGQETPDCARTHDRETEGPTVERAVQRAPFPRMAAAMARM